jgi:Gelsolin repeat
VKEVPLAASSLTQGDVYILDAAMKIYIFVGPTANMFEKTKGK